MPISHDARRKLAAQLISAFFGIVAIAMGVLVQDAPRAAMMWVVAGSIVGSSMSVLWVLLRGKLERVLLVAALLGVAVCWSKAWIELSKPETPNLTATFVPEPSQNGSPMSAHIDVQNLGKQDWAILLKRYLGPGGIAVGADIQKQISIHGRSVRVDIPMSPDFIEHVVKKLGAFNFELTLAPLDAPKGKLLKLTYPLEFRDNALAANVQPTTGVPVQPGTDPVVRSEADLFAILASPDGHLLRVQGEKNPDGTENRGCFPTPFNGAWVYWPSHGIFSWSIVQRGVRKEMIAHFKPAASHKIVLDWNNASGLMKLSVDGVPAQEYGEQDGNHPWGLSCPF